METVAMQHLTVSRFILGSNPFSGFSHMDPAMDLAMKRYFTTARIKDLLFRAQALGVNTLIARTDQHVMRFLLEYWDEGGSLQWFAQTCPEVGDPPTCIQRAAASKAKACHLHGGWMDYIYAQGRLDEIPPALEMIRERGMLAGIAAHNPQVIAWADDHLEVDYYMCSYYNAAHRDQRAEHVSGMEEWFVEEDRKVMTALIQRLSRPAIHYKILAAGRNDPAEAFDVAARAMRPNDMVCVGVFDRDQADMLKQDVELFQQALARHR
ncbi:MAG: hypothetical protein JXA78_02300 [Anaerolineales bacterium]|nr:hypothetical protein [Anaerolineales bacterium]